MEATVISVLCAVIVGLIGFLCRLALSDRDKKINKIEEDLESLEDNFNEERSKVIVLQTSFGTILQSISKLEGKLDKLLEDDKR